VKTNGRPAVVVGLPRGIDGPLVKTKGPSAKNEGHPGKTMGPFEKKDVRLGMNNRCFGMKNGRFATKAGWIWKTQ